MELNKLSYLFNKYALNKNKKINKINGKRYTTLISIFNKFEYKLGAEIGVWRGAYSKAICQSDPELKLYAIDKWQDEMVNGKPMSFWHRDAVRRLEPYNCQIIQDSSENAVKRFNDESLDFVFIDSDHDSKSVTEDIKKWSKKVREGGIVSGHDYYNGKHPDFDGSIRNYEIENIVNGWIERNNIDHLFVLVGDQTPSWFYIK